MKKRVLIIIALLTAAAGLSHALVKHQVLGFEKADAGRWSGPWGYGTLGGKGNGAILTQEDGALVRSGERALQLTVEDDGSPGAVAWSGISHTESCIPRSRIKAGAYFMYSSCDSPPTEGRAVGQLRLEYYSDDYGQQIIPTHVSLSAPFVSADGCKPDTWYLVQVYDKVPANARSMRFSILLLSQQPNGEKKQIWVDDAFIESQTPRPHYRAM